MAITPFKVIQGHRFCYQLKARTAYDLLLVIENNLPHILHHFQVIADYVKFSLATGGRFTLMGVK